MNKKWKIHEVSTSERIFSKIKIEMTRPIGIFIYGADCELKNEVLEMAADELGDIACFYTNVPDTATIVNTLKTSSLVIMMNAAESSLRDLRHELEKLMCKAGAKTVEEKEG